MRPSFCFRWTLISAAAAAVNCFVIYVAGVYKPPCIWGGGPPPPTSPEFVELSVTAFVLWILACSTAGVGLYEGEPFTLFVSVLTFDCFVGTIGVLRLAVCF